MPLSRSFQGASCENVRKEVARTRTERKHNAFGLRNGELRELLERLTDAGQSGVRKNQGAGTILGATACSELGREHQVFDAR
jgi:proline dehydrogenase